MVGLLPSNKICLSGILGFSINNSLEKLWHIYPLLSDLAELIQPVEAHFITDLIEW